MRRDFEGPDRDDCVYSATLNTTTLSATRVKYRLIIHDDSQKELVLY